MNRERPYYYYSFNILIHMQRRLKYKCILMFKTCIKLLIEDGSIINSCMLLIQVYNREEIFYIRIYHIKINNNIVLKYDYHTHIPIRNWIVCNWTTINYAFTNFTIQQTKIVGIKSLRVYNL